MSGKNVEGKSSTLSQQIKLVKKWKERRWNGRVLLVADRRFSDICIWKHFCISKRGYKEVANGVSCSI